MTSFSENQTIQFARPVGFNVILASCGLLEDLLLVSRAVSGLGLHSAHGSSLLENLVGAT